MRLEKISSLKRHFFFMPFTFKPEISEQPTGQAAAPSAFGNSQPVADLALRNPEEGRSIIELILMVACGISILIAIGMFGYSYYLSSQIESKKATLRSYESSLGSLPLDDMRNLSNRMKVISKLVAQHPSVNVAFKIVENSIEDAVTYNQFDLHYVDSAKAYSISLGGISPDYKSVAQQMDTLNRKPYSNYLQDIKLDGLSLDDKGVVRFAVKSMIVIIGLLPDDINLTDGMASLVASTTPEGSPAQEDASSTQAQ
jgi:hypothetical protein